MKTILDNIVKSTALFLSNDMCIDILKIKRIEEIPYSPHNSLITLTNDSKMTVMINIDNSLFKFLFKKFFTKVQEDEKIALIAALSDEIINIVVGLSIKNFSSKYANCELGLPFKVSVQKRKEMIKKYPSQSMCIVTGAGNFICTIL